MSNKINNHMRITELFEDKDLGHIVNASKKAYRTLSDPAKDAIDSWEHMNWDTGDLVASHRDKSDIIQEINRAFEPVRDVITQQFGSTVPLYRGERPFAKVDDSKMLYSWTYEQKTADAFAGRYTPYSTVLSDEQIRHYTDRYNKTGYVKVFNRHLKQSKEYPEYFDIYDSDGEHITDGDHIFDYITDENNYRKKRNAEEQSKNIVYKENVPVDKIIWVSNRLNSKEFIVAQPPAR